MQTLTLRMDEPKGPTGNYIQSPEINHHEKEYKKECIYVYNYHLAVQQKLAQHCNSTIL